jgi:Ca2+/H+ antiporter
MYSNWAEASIAIVAILKSREEMLRPFVVGTIAINYLLLLGICFIHGGHYDRGTAYSMLMVSVYARMLPLCVVPLVGAAWLDVGFRGR